MSSEQGSNFANAGKKAVHVKVSGFLYCAILFQIVRLNFECFCVWMKPCVKVMRFGTMPRWPRSWDRIHRKAWKRVVTVMNLLYRFGRTIVQSLFQRTAAKICLPFSRRTCSNISLFSFIVDGVLDFTTDSTVHDCTEFQNFTCILKFSMDAGCQVHLCTTYDVPVP